MVDNAHVMFAVTELGGHVNFIQAYTRHTARASHKCDSCFAVIVDLHSHGIFSQGLNPLSVDSSWMAGVSLDYLQVAIQEAALLRQEGAGKDAHTDAES